MRFLADENVPGPLVEALRSHGHEVRWVRTDSPGSADHELLAQAQQEDRILLTFDKDFGSLVFLERLPALFGVVLLRIEHLPTARIIGLVLQAIKQDAPGRGRFVVMEEDRIRIAPLPG